MGLFSSSTKINVFSNAMPLCDTDTNLMAKTVIQTVLTGGDVVDGIEYLAFHGVSTKITGMMNYAREHYTLGLPSGSSKITTILDDADVADAITLDLTLTNGCIVDYNYVAPLSNIHIVFPFLTKERLYDPVTGVIAVFPGSVIYPTLPTPGTNETITATHKMTVTSIDFDADLSTTTGTVTINYNLATTYDLMTISSDANGEPNNTHDYTTIDTAQSEEITITVGLDGYQLGNTYCIAKYYVLDEFGTPSATADWWFYDMASELYPLLTLADTADNTDNLFPVVPLRYNNQSYTDTAHQSTELYITSHKLLKKIGVDIDTVTEALEDNPDIGDIDHAYIMFGINMQTERNAEIRYLTEFFDYLADSAIIDQSTLTNSLITAAPVSDATYSFHHGSSPGTTPTQITRPSTDANGVGYNVTTTNTETAFSLVENGLNVGIQYNAISSTLVNGSLGQVGTATMTKEAGTGNGFINTKTANNNSVLTLRLQITATVYKEVIVRGLCHYNNVYKKYTVWTTLNDIIDDADNDNFIIPLHYGVAKQIPPMQRGDLYLGSLQIVCQSIVKTKVKWYQKGIFKFLSILIALILFVITGNPYFLYAAIGSIVLTALAAILPPDIMLALEVIFIVYQAVTLDWAGIANNMANATTYLEAVTLAASINNSITGLRIRGLQGEFEDLVIDQKAKMEELTALMEELDVSTILDPGLLLNGVRYQPMLMSSPAAFYGVKLMSNPGVYALSAPATFVQQSLQLPDFSFA